MRIPLATLVALFALPALAQELVPGDATPPAPPDAQAPADAQAAAEALAEAAAPQDDPVAAWTVDRTAVLEGEGLDLAAFQYVARPFVIFADSPLQPQLAEQLRILAAGSASLGLRDVAVIVDSDPDARSVLRRELRPRGFGVVLVDKDGRVVLRRPTPLSVREIEGAIDRTPLRREELRAAGQGGE